MNSKEILKELVKYNTIKDKDNSGIMNYIEKYLQKLGFKTEYKTKCLVMSIKEDAPFGFLGHTDTVSYSDWATDPFDLTEKDGKLYGLGTSDMKGSIAAILAAVSKIDWTKTKKGVKLYFTYDEEIGFLGIKELVDNNIAFPNTIVIGEPTNNEIINSSKGLLELKLTFNGVSSHSSKPEEGINAIEKCLDFITKLKEYYQELKEEEKLESKYITMNVGIINGGRMINIVPDSCEVFIDFRTIFVSQNERIIKRIKEYVENNNASYEIINNIKPFLNKTGKMNMSDYISEASFIEAENRYILGVGPNNAHKRDEFINISSLEELEKQYIDIIKEKCE